MILAATLGPRRQLLNFRQPAAQSFLDPGLSVIMCMATCRRRTGGCVPMVDQLRPDRLKMDLFEDWWTHQGPITDNTSTLYTATSNEITKTKQPYEPNITDAFLVYRYNIGPRYHLC